MTIADQVRALAARPCGVTISDVMRECGVAADVANGSIKSARKSLTQPGYVYAKMPGYRPRLFASAALRDAWAATCLPVSVLRKQRADARYAAVRKERSPKLHAIGTVVPGARNNDGSKTTKHQATGGRQKLLTAPFADRPVDYSRALVVVCPAAKVFGRYYVDPTTVQALFSAMPQGTYLSE